ncbi:isochorismatase family protein [Demequina lignilytica]|uniref:Isochorismatase family protein n=1 Tax=Demequina lignilytica TaxID=3051663 RepID=A0AB35MGL7_9MICO|nr:isochorismatase family protein [Demequina sp. SYSU T0a273]MDN4482865.1 isochorismatase family protein [Demequina sp. SYSU T0a273]
MTTLDGRPATALLVIDMQHDVVVAAHDRDGVIARIAAMVKRARKAGAPVIWVQHSDAGMPEGSEGWRYVPELTMKAGEPVIHKRYGDAFEGTGLEAELANAAVGHLVVCGAQTDMCLRSTIHGAFTRGYDVTLVGDSHTTEDLTELGAPPMADVIAHTNLYWESQRAPGRTAAVVPAAEVFAS